MFYVTSILLQSSSYRKSFQITVYIENNLSLFYISVLSILIKVRCEFCLETFVRTRRLKYQTQNIPFSFNGWPTSHFTFSLSLSLSLSLLYSAFLHKRMLSRFLLLFITCLHRRVAVVAMYLRIHKIYIACRRQFSQCGSDWFWRVMQFFDSSYLFYCSQF